MSDRRELLALRREVLVARAGLQRVAIASDIDALRASLRWPRAATSVATSPVVRSLAFGSLVLVAGRARVARWIGLAMTALTVAKLVLALARPKVRSLAPAQPLASEIDAT